MCAAARSAQGYCRTTTCSADGAQCETDVDGCVRGGKPLAWPQGCTSFTMLEGQFLAGIPRQTSRRIVTEAFSRWTTADCGGATPSISVAPTTQLSRCARPDYDEDAGNANVWMFETKVWPYHEDALAVTVVTFDYDTGAIVDADVELNATLKLTTQHDEVVYDLASIVQHESGHFLGLSHSSVREATMWRRVERGSTDARTLEADDTAAVCDAYPPERAVNTCDFSPRNGFSAECSEDTSCRAVAARPRTRAHGVASWALLALVGALRSSRSRRRPIEIARNGLR